MALKMHPTVNASRGLPGTCSLRVAQNARVPILGAEASQGSQRFTFRCGQKVQMSCLFSQLFPATRRPVFIMECGAWSVECGVCMMYTCTKIHPAAVQVSLGWALVWIMQINAPSAEQETGFVQICIFICWRSALAYGKVTPVQVRTSARHSGRLGWMGWLLQATGCLSSQLIYLAMRLQRHYLEWWQYLGAPRDSRSLAVLNAKLLLFFRR